MLPQCLLLFSYEYTTYTGNKDTEHNGNDSREQRMKARNEIKENGNGGGKKTTRKTSQKEAKTLKAIIDLGYNEVFRMEDCWSWSDDGEG